MFLQFMGSVDDVSARLIALMLTQIHTILLIMILYFIALISPKVTSNCLVSVQVLRI